MNFAQLCEKISEDSGIPLPKTRKVLKSFINETVTLINSDSEDDTISLPQLRIKRKVKSDQEEITNRSRKAIIFLKPKKAASEINELEDQESQESVDLED